MSETGKKAEKEEDFRLRFFRMCNTVTEYRILALYYRANIYVCTLVQSSVKTFLPGFGNGWLKYCAIVHFRGEQRKILRVILETMQECVFTTL